MKRVDELIEYLEENGVKQGTEEEFEEESFFNFEVKGESPKRDITIRLRSLLLRELPLFITIFYYEETDRWVQANQKHEGIARCGHPDDNTFETFKDHIIKVVETMEKEREELKDIDGFGTCKTCVFPKVIDGDKICDHCEEFSMHHYIDRCLPPNQLEVVTNEYTGKPLVQVIKVEE